MRLLPPVRPSTCARVRHSGSEELAPRAEEVEPLREHADDGRRRAVERQRLSDDVAIATEASLPHGVAQDHDRRDLIDHVLGVGECSAHDRLDAERAEHRRRHGLAEDSLGRARRRRSKPSVFTPQATPLNAATDSNDRAVISERGELRDAGRAELLGSVRGDRPDRDQPIGLGQSQRPQQRSNRAG